MKIDNSYKPTTTAPPSKAPATQPTPAATTQDAVSLSSLSSTLQAGQKPPVNTARIQEIKQAISEGRFKINPETIADRLIESARELVNSSNQRQA